MTLRDVVDQLDALPNSDTIYAEDLASVEERGGSVADARAVVTTEGEDGLPPPSAEGLRYFLEVRIAKEAIRVWCQWRDGAVPSLDEKLAAVVYYAVNDAFLPLTAEP